MPDLPPVVDEPTWHAELDALRVREKPATRELDAIGAAGPVRLTDVFDAERQLITYHHMWTDGADWQCPGCTGYTAQFTRLEFLDSYGARFVVVTNGPIDADSSFGAGMGAGPGEGFAINVFLRDPGTGTVHRTWHTNGRGTEQLGHTFGLIDVLAYGRQEERQDSPDGWPQSPTYSRWPGSEDVAQAHRSQQ